jgi:hypothetical protein
MVRASASRTYVNNNKLSVAPRTGSRQSVGEKNAKPKEAGKKGKAVKGLLTASRLVAAVPAKVEGRGTRVEKCSRNFAFDTFFTLGC